MVIILVSTYLQCLAISALFNVWISVELMLVAIARHYAHCAHPLFTCIGILMFDI